jgi:hypothetical protein
MNDIHLYKKALIFTKELSKLEQSMKNALAEIERYKKYIPAQECIETLSRNLSIVQIHLAHQQKIVNNKGAKE